MKPTRGRRGLLGWLIVALLLIGALAVLRTRWAWNEACALARQKLPQATHLDLDIGRCEIDALRAGVKLYDVSAALPGHPGPPLLTAESAEIRLGGSIAPLFGALELSRVHLDHPRLFLDLTQPPAQPKGQRGVCPLDALDKVALDKLQAHDATVQVRFPGDRGLELSDVNLEWTTRRGVVEIDFGAGSGVLRQGAGRPELLVGKVTLQAVLDLEAQQLQLTGPGAEGTVDDVTFNVGGRVDTLCDPNLLLDAQARIPLHTLAKVVPLPEKPQGHVLARVQATGHPDALAFAGEITGAGVHVGRFDPESFTAKATLEGRELHLVDLNVPVPPLGAAHLSGTVQLQEHFPVRALLILERAELGKVLDKLPVKGSWVDLVATGRGAVEGTVSPLQLAGNADFQVSDFRLTPRAYDAPAEGRPMLELKEGRARGNLKVLADRVELSDLDIAAGRSRVVGAATMHYAQDEGLFIQGRADPLDLSDFGHLAKFDWRGTGAVSFIVKGPYRDVRAESQVSLRDFSFWDYNPGVVQGDLLFEHRALHFPAFTGQKGKTSYQGSADLDWAREKNGVMRLSLQVPRGRAEDLVDAISRLHPGVELFQGELFGDARGKVELSGPLDRFSGAIDFDLQGLRYYDRDLGQGRVALKFHDGETMELTEGRLDGAAGQLQVDGTFSFAGPLHYRFRGDELQLAEIVGREPARQFGVSGALAVSGKVSGNRDLPVVEAYITSTRVGFADRSLGPMTLNARIEGRELQLWGKPFADATGSLKMTLKAPIPYQVSLKVALPEIRPLLPDAAISQGVSGTLSGTFSARGEVKTKGSISAEGVVQRLSLTRGDFSGETERPVAISYERGKLAMDPLVFVG
ncbi:MAG TPA: translocation/assembly module TamB, partial [Myxococcales bacterium]|nr:translocation/assembly module TamB [Myxococcales bacterium]